MTIPEHFGAKWTPARRVSQPRSFVGRKSDKQTDKALSGFGTIQERD
jgi:hypothetical protein